MASERGWRDEGDEGSRPHESWAEQSSGRFGGWREEGRGWGERGFWSGPAEWRRELYGDWSSEAGGHRGRGPRSYRRSDRRILEDVSDRLTDDPFVDASEIEVTAENGEVTLKGFVDDRGTRRRAEDLALEVPGIVHVQNNLRLRQQGTTATLGGYGTPVAAAYGLDATPSADAPKHGSTSGPATIEPAAAPQSEDTGSSSAARSEGTTTAATTAAATAGATAERAGAAMHTVAAVFDGRAEAERAAADLAGIGVPGSAVAIIRDDSAPVGTTSEPPQEERGFLASLAALFLPSEDQRSYEEGIRRGGVLVAARVEEARVEETMAVLESAGAIDLDERAGQWRATGWKQYEPLPGAEATPPGRGGRRARSYAAAHSEEASTRH
ncbi:BON domain-containing protein [Benzoatithermus flavus]|uniref:BON domain-containing protein n=1 Tax=Benzoatithermus flavus TaxID=3108223 RepID=A0ABU8XRZ7_9PROT